MSLLVLQRVVDLSKMCDSQHHTSHKLINDLQSLVSIHHKLHILCNLHNAIDSNLAPFGPLHEMHHYQELSAELMMNRQLKG